MKKKYLVILLIVLSCFLVGCTKKEENKEKKEIKIKESNAKEAKEEWSYDVDNSQQMLSDDILEIFADSEEKLEPIALLGKQIVSGTNNMFLAKTEIDGTKEYKIVIIYKNLQGKAEITSIKDFDIEKYTNKNIELEKEEITGSWTTSIPGKPIMLDQKIQNYFDKATSELTKATYYPISVLAKQEKKDTNYAIICFGSYSDQNQRTGIFMLTMNVNDSDESKITSIAAINLKEFNED